MKKKLFYIWALILPANKVVSKIISHRINPVGIMIISLPIAGLTADDFFRNIIFT